MTQNLSILIARVVSGEPGATSVLMDMLLEQGATPHAAISFINALTLGDELTDPYFASKLPASLPPHAVTLADAIRPFVLFDTVPVQWGGTRFFSDFQMREGVRVRTKTEAERNFVAAGRLSSYCSMALRRVSVEVPDEVAWQGSLTLRINAREVLHLPLSDLRLRGVFGFPVVEDFSDRDDIRAWVDFYNVAEDVEQLPDGRYVKLKLHGLLRAPVR